VGSVGTEQYRIKLDAGEAIITVPARMSWEDRNRLKKMVDLIPDPPKKEAAADGGRD
jgi:hypothetical protein